ncbi:MAG: phytoene desaturase family protein, partial [Candidatus Dormibacteria bacterium]
MADGRYDACVVGSGPNGLAGALTLARAGLRVLVVEGAERPGGGCRTESLTLPGFRHDTCSTAHPLAAASRFFRDFGLADHGVELLHPQVVYGHALDGGRAAVVRRSVEETAQGLGADAEAYRRLFGPLSRQGRQLADWLLSSQRRPPAHPLALARFGLLGLRPASALVARYRSEAARALFAGVAAHAMRPLERPPSGAVGLFLATLAHTVGWPVVAGGSQQLTDAMVAALEQAGGTLETGRWLGSLGELPATPATLLDVTPRQLLQLAPGRLPDGYRRAMERFRYGSGVFKADYALSAPVPWRSPELQLAGTVHLGGTFAEVAASERAVARGEHPPSPYVLTVQASLVDPSRAPQGQHTLWAYCHVPAGSDVDMGPALEAQLERFAPGFRDLVLGRSGRTAREQEQHDPNYVGGDIASGRQDLRQTLLRPGLRWNPYRTPIPGVYLCSASTTPGP